MARGKLITQSEKRQMVKLHKAGLNNVQVAKELGRSNQAVGEVLKAFKNRAKYSDKYRTLNASQADWAYVREVADKTGTPMIEVISDLVRSHQDGSRQERVNNLEKMMHAEPKKTWWERIWG